MLIKDDKTQRHMDKRQKHMYVPMYVCMHVCNENILFRHIWSVQNGVNFNHFLP